MVKVMLNVRAGLPGKVDICQRFTHGLVKYLEAMELVLTSEQVDDLAFVGGMIHRLRVVILRGLVTVDGNDSMRGEDIVPQFVLQRIVNRTVLCVPPEMLISVIGSSTGLAMQRSMATYRASLGSTYRMMKVL